MNIRKATIADFSYIRKMPVQLTPRPVTALQPKHFRVLAQEADVRLLVFQGTHAPGAFLALRFMPAEDSVIRFLVIVHLGLDRHASNSNVAAELEEKATAIAREHQCTALLVQAKPLTFSAAGFYQERGYILHGDVFMKRLQHV